MKDQWRSAVLNDAENKVPPKKKKAWYWDWEGKNDFTGNLVFLLKSLHLWNVYTYLKIALSQIFVSNSILKH